MTCSIEFKSEGKSFTQKEIYDMEYSRYQKVLSEFVEKGVLKPEQIDGISLEDARPLLAETKEKLGREKIQELYREELLAGDEMWHEIASKSRTKENLQQKIVEVHAKGISIYQFMMVNGSLAKENNLYLPSMVHPEHYSFEARGGEQIIIERFGMYKYPAYMHLIPAKDGYRPIPVDEDTTMVMVGYTTLMHDESDTKLVGMHQFKECDDGLKVKLGVFLPEAAPKEMLEGHQWHLMVEFNNCLHMAEKQKVGAAQKLLMKQALKKMRG
ncbi:MAG: hypothetical protein ACI4W2_01515 [Eubacterium sp.]